MIGLHELAYSDTFEKDLKSLSKPAQLHLKNLINKIMQSPLRFKPLKGYSNIFRIRFEQFRLIYKVDGNKVILLFVRKRDIVYRGI